MGWEDIMVAGEVIVMGLFIIIKERFRDLNHMVCIRRPHGRSWNLQYKIKMGQSGVNKHVLYFSGYGR